MSDKSSFELSQDQRARIDEMGALTASAAGNVSSGLNLYADLLGSFSREIVAITATAGGADAVDDNFDLYCALSRIGGTEGSYTIAGIKAALSRIEEARLLIDEHFPKLQQE